MAVTVRTEASRRCAPSCESPSGRGMQGIRNVKVCSRYCNLVFAICLFKCFLTVIVPQLEPIWDWSPPCRKKGPEHMKQQVGCKARVYQRMVGHPRPCSFAERQAPGPSSVLRRVLASEGCRVVQLPRASPAPGASWPGCPAGSNGLRLLRAAVASLLHARHPVAGGADLVRRTGRPSHLSGTCRKVFFTNTPRATSIAPRGPPELKKTA
mmetsp:Transcript_102084/g.284200  ORF Transcript_102084/g.284200 Transcript_102084/m.284200 type:complete len:210 (+) Transcript_102084:845-1474(+)